MCGHIGYPWTMEMIAVADKHPNVYIDTSAYASHRYPAELVDYLSGRGRQKVLFATNYPMMTAARALARLDDLGLDAEVRAGAGWGTLDVDAGGESRHLGAHGAHQARVRAQPFELLRAVSMRRSVRQIRALDWDGDVDSLLSLLQSSLTGGYALPDADLVE